MRIRRNHLANATGLEHERWKLAELIRREETAGSTARFVFADYSISAHEHAVELTAASPVCGSGYAIGSGPVLIARTFSEFLARYLDRDDGVLFGWVRK